VGVRAVIREFRLNGWRVQPQFHQLVGPGGAVEVEAHSMEVLVALAEQAGEVVSRQELMERVWGESIIEEGALTHAIWDLRRALHDDPKKPDFIQTLPKTGYRLLAKVSWLDRGVGETERYRLLAQIGGGGMGVVFKAEDTRLRRQVALKFLPPEWSRDSLAKARFLREARVAAALDHPNLCTLHEIDETDDGRLFLVMALYEGETLKQRLARGRIETSKALEIAGQMAQGVSALHKVGVFHRDIKPANVMLPKDGPARILDFGLAKFAGGTQLTATSSSPGTPTYMSPEQVRGEEVDARTDVWSLGAVLYEMVAGQPPFGRANASAVMFSILEREPPALETGDGELPEGVRGVVSKSLAKSVEDRFSDAGELILTLGRCGVRVNEKEPVHDIVGARVEQQKAVEEPESPKSDRVSPRPAWQWALLWLSVLLALALGWILTAQPEPPPLPTVRFELELTEGNRLVHSHRHGFALSPDGTQLAYVSGTPANWKVADRSQIYVRQLDAFESLPLAGTERTSQPVFSPDGRWLAFVALDPPRLEKMLIEGGEPQTLCECDASFGVSWGPDNTIVFAGIEGGLKQVSAFGGTPEPLTEVDAGAGEVSHRLPHYLPDGRSVLFTVQTELSLVDFQTTAIGALDLSTGERKLLVEAGTDGRHLPPDYLIFGREGTLMAVRFDPERLQVTGPEVQVLHGVSQSAAVGHTSFDTGAAQFSLSSTGSLAYAEGFGFYPPVPGALAFFDRQGQSEPVEIEPKDWLSVRMDRARPRILLTTAHPPRDAWLFDLERRMLTRQTFTEAGISAIWGPGPEEFTFSSRRDGVGSIFRKPVDFGPGGAIRLADESDGPEDAHVGSWLPDGRVLAFVSDSDLWTYSEEAGFEPLLQSKFNEAYPEFSPDGRWLAYVSDHSGRDEVYVRPWPGPGSAVQISEGGGAKLAWAPDGREVFYRQARSFFGVTVEVTDNRLIAGRPEELFQEDFSHSTSPLRSYEVTPDGRFLLIGHSGQMNNPSESGVESFGWPESIDKVFPVRIKLVQNWVAELEQKLPSD
jgi:serine/threonine-protein kinase